MPPPNTTLPGPELENAPACRSKPPGSSGTSWFDDALSVPDRVGYIKDAVFLAAQQYTGPAIMKRLGNDFRAVVDGLIFGLVMALGVMIVTTLLGGIIGGGVGALAGGVGAGPGAAYGARLGGLIGEWLLQWLGVAFLISYLAENFSALTERFGNAISLAWNSDGTSCAIEMAAREFADGVATFFSLLVQALVLYLTKEAAEGRILNALKAMRESKLFRRAANMEAWLGKNFARLRAKYIKLTWTVLAESTEKIPGTSIPVSMRLKVGQREFLVERSAVKADGTVIGPATKHMGEVAVKANEWAKIAGTDFPISSLAGALDQAEAQLIFQSPNQRAQPVKLDHWELLIDTTKPVWKVFHANYTTTPKW